MKFLLPIFLCVTVSVAHPQSQYPSYRAIKLVNGDSTNIGTIVDGAIFYNQVSEKFRFRQNGTWISFNSGNTAVFWGTILGTLSNQTDLQNALNGKVNNTIQVAGQPLTANVTAAMIGNALGIWQAWVPAWTGFSSDPTGITARYVQIGKSVSCYLTATANGTSNSTATTVTLPIAARTGSTQVGFITWVNNGNSGAAIGIIVTRSGSAVADLYRDGTGLAWTSTATGKKAQFSFTYETD